MDKAFFEIKGLCFFRYLLIDTWKSGEAYQQFLKANEKQYRSLSRSFESIIKKEEKIGEFQALD